MRIGNEMEFMATRGSDGVAAARIWEKQVNGYVLKSIPHQSTMCCHFILCQQWTCEENKAQKFAENRQ